MADGITRAAIVGAATLLGKELAEELSAASMPWDVVVLGEEDSAGTLTSAGDEALVVRPLTAESFKGVDVAFFAASRQLSLAHWRNAAAEGVRVVDLTGAIEGEPGVLVRSPWLQGGRAPDLATAAVVPAHPAAVMLALVLSPLQKKFPEVHFAATVLEPASQQGSAGIDELHQQTLSLLGFKELPKTIYDAQVAFNLLVNVGSRKEINLERIAATVRQHLSAITGNPIEGALALQMVQAPVFHGYAISVYVELSIETDTAAVAECLRCAQLQVVEEEDAPSNQSAAGEVILVRIKGDAGGRKEGSSSFWLWMVADNLRLMTREAADCGRELGALSSRTRVQ